MPKKFHSWLPRLPCTLAQPALAGCLSFQYPACPNAHSSQGPLTLPGNWETTGQITRKAEHVYTGDSISPRACLLTIWAPLSELVGQRQEKARSSEWTPPEMWLRHSMAFRWLHQVPAGRWEESAIVHWGFRVQRLPSLRSGVVETKSRQQLNASVELNAHLYLRLFSSLTFSIAPYFELGFYIWNARTVIPPDCTIEMHW